MRSNIAACRVGLIGNDDTRDHCIGSFSVVLFLADCERRWQMSDFVKWDEGKAPFFELCTYRRDVLENEARVLKLGADRYGRDNWHKANSAEGKERYTAALMRHVFALLHGEFIDPDSGLPHTAHIRVNAAFLETFAPSQSCPNDADARVAGKSDLHQRLHDEYYTNDQKPMPPNHRGNPNKMNRCASMACTADLEDKGTEYVGISGYHYCSEKCADEMTDT